MKCLSDYSIYENNNGISADRRLELIFSKFLMSGANFAYQPYRILLRTALSKKLKKYLTPICIFRGPA